LYNKDLFKMLEFKHLYKEKFYILFRWHLDREIMRKAAFDKLKPLSHKNLLAIRLKAYRNGGWRRLRGFEKALFKASLELAKLRGRIVNPSLIKAVENIVSKLLQTPAEKILQLGRRHASRLLELYEENRVLKWAPSIRNWLKDPEYLFWLGVSQNTLRSVGYV